MCNHKALLSYDKVLLLACHDLVTSVGGEAPYEVAPRAQYQSNVLIRPQQSSTNEPFGGWVEKYWKSLPSSLIPESIHFIYSHDSLHALLPATATYPPC